MESPFLVELTMLGVDEHVVLSFCKLRGSNIVKHMAEVVGWNSLRRLACPPLSTLSLSIGIHLASPDHMPSPPPFHPDNQPTLSPPPPSPRNSNFISRSHPPSVSKPIPHFPSPSHTKPTATPQNQPPISNRPTHPRVKQSPPLHPAQPPTCIAPHLLYVWDPGRRHLAGKLLSLW